MLELLARQAAIAFFVHLAHINLLSHTYALLTWDLDAGITDVTRSHCVLCTYLIHAPCGLIHTHFLIWDLDAGITGATSS